MALKQDAFNIEIKEDGTIRVTTDAVSAANHTNAEQFLRFMAQQAGGDTIRTRRGDKHSHGAHTHSHDHGDHEHDHH